jgi:hypothetical protein
MQEVDKEAFFKLLNRAAQPLRKEGGKTSESRSSVDCNGKQTHSCTSGDASAKHDEKSR